MDKFSIKNSTFILLGVRSAAPIFIGCLSIWAVSSGSFMNFEYGPIGWIASLGFIGYGLYNIFQIVKASQFELQISDEKISINGDCRTWDEIKIARFKYASGMETAVTLTTLNGTTLDIPAATENLAFIWAKIQKHVEDSESPS